MLTVHKFPRSGGIVSMMSMIIEFGFFLRMRSFTTYVCFIRCKWFLASHFFFVVSYFGFRTIIIICVFRYRRHVADERNFQFRRHMEELSSIDFSLLYFYVHMYVHICKRNSIWLLWLGVILGNDRCPSEQSVAYASKNVLKSAWFIGHGFWRGLLRERSRSLMGDLHISTLRAWRCGVFHVA